MNWVRRGTRTGEGLERRGGGSRKGIREVEKSG